MYIHLLNKIYFYINIRTLTWTKIKEIPEDIGELENLTTL